MHNKIKRGFLSRLFISYTPRVHMQYRNITGVDNLVGFGRFKNQEKRKSIVSLSPSATLRLQELIADSNKLVKLRLKVKGCNGFVYEMALEDLNNIGEMDEIIYNEHSKPILAIDNFAVFYMLNCRIDYKVDDLSEGFTFENPNVKSQCGCGQSFHF